MVYYKHSLKSKRMIWNGWYKMDALSLAPCGVLCDLCLGFQRTRNRCVGCNHSGNKPHHCIVCSIRNCLKKNGDVHQLCSSCGKFPCRRIKDLDKRYRTRYGESPIENLLRAEEMGEEAFIKGEDERWRCAGCRELLCVHRENCLNCGAGNPYYPKNQER